MDSIISRYYQTKERISEMEDRIEELLNASNHKEKINTCEYNIQEIWNTIKRQNLRIHGVEEGAEMQTKGIGNLFNEIIAENLSNLELQIDMIRK
jgi:hypothetical protein